MRAVIVLLGLLLAAADAPAAPKDPVAKPAGAPVEGTVRSLADKTPIHYRSTGKGGLSVVLIHCWSCDSSMWDATAAELAKTRRVVTVDLAGHGASGRERKAWTVRSYAADVKSVIEALGLRRVILVGHSMGGVVMLETARMMSGGVVALVAVDTLHDLGARYTPEQQAQFLAPFEEDFAQGADALVRSLFPKDADPALVDRVAKQLSSAPPEIALPTMRGLLEYDEKPTLERLRHMPIIALNSTLIPTDVEGNRALAPKFELSPLEGVGHFPQLERPDEFNAALLKVLARFK